MAFLSSLQRSHHSTSPQGMTIPMLIVVFLGLLLCIVRFRELDERTSITPPALRSASPGKETIKYHELKKSLASSDTVFRSTPLLALKEENNDSSPATSTNININHSNSTIDTVDAEQQALAEAEINIVTKDAVVDETVEVREAASGAGLGTAEHFKSPPPGLNITNTSSIGADNSVTATGGPGGRGGPDSFCSWPASYNLERQWVRDVICSNLNEKITSRTSDSENAEYSNLLPNSRHIMFYHIPKTGGESLEGALSIKKDHKEWWDRSEEREKIGDSNRVSITIIRNPYSRMLSWFRFCLHGWRGYLPGPTKHCLLAHQYINDQVKENDQDHSPETVSTAFEGWLGEIFLSPGLHHSFLTSNYQEFLGGVSPLHIDYIIRFEHYAEDYALLAEALGIKKDLTKKNGSKNGEGKLDAKAYNKWKVTYNPEVAKLLVLDYHEIYTERGRTLVEMAFASDLQYFNYTF